jgi:Domain of unknown function (DUF5666)
MERFVDAVPNWQDQPPPLHRPWRRWLLIGGIALAFTLTLGLGALLGSQMFAAHAAASSGSNGSLAVFNQGAGQGPGGPISFQSGSQGLAGTPGAGAPCVMLTVSSVSGSTITAKDAHGTTVTVHTTASTTYTENGTSASASAVTVGSHISVMGSHNSDGSITATSINVA